MMALIFNISPMSVSFIGVSQVLSECYGVSIFSWEKEHIFYNIPLSTKQLGQLSKLISSEEILNFNKFTDLYSNRKIGEDVFNYFFNYRESRNSELPTYNLLPVTLLQSNLVSLRKRFLIKFNF